MRRNPTRKLPRVPSYDGIEMASPNAGLEGGALSTTVVIAKCMSKKCGFRKEYKPGEVPEGDHPCCEKCGMPMVAERAAVRK